MAHEHDITINIKFNEHDNETYVLEQLLNHLSAFKRTIDTDMKHEDIFFDIDLHELKEYATEEQDKRIKVLFTDFPDWGRE